MKKGSKNDTLDKKKEFLIVFSKDKGMVTFSCLKVGIENSTYWDWCQKDPWFKNECQKILDSVGDFVEHQLLKQIEDGVLTAIIFYCKTKLKNRGYIERVELQEDLEITINDKIIKPRLINKNELPE